MICCLPYGALLHSVVSFLFVFLVIVSGSVVAYHPMFCCLPSCFVPNQLAAAVYLLVFLPVNLMLLLLFCFVV
jgi:hypothetical protein